MPQPPLIRHLLITVTLLAGIVLGMPSAAAAAEIFQIQDGDRLLIGDRNRVYGVLLACVSIDPGLEDDAAQWLRHALPRHTRVNLRPIGQRDGLLLARVRRLDADTDVAEGLIEAGLAHPARCSADREPLR